MKFNFNTDHLIILDNNNNETVEISNYDSKTHTFPTRTIPF